MTATSTTRAASAAGPGGFVTVPGDRRSEVARTLAEPVPQALSLLDQPASILSFAAAAAALLTGLATGLTGPDPAGTRAAGTRATAPGAGGSSGARSPGGPG